MTKNHLFTTIFAMFFTQVSYGQYVNLNYSEYSSLSPEMGLTGGTSQRKLKEAGVTAMEIEYSRQNGNRTRDLGNYRYSLDTAGYVARLQKFDGKGKRTEDRTMAYNAYGFLTAYVTLNDKGDTINKTLQEYNPANKMSTSLKYAKKGRLKYAYVYNYEADTQLVQQQQFKKEKLITNWVYKYHPNGDRSETQKMNGKGKVKAIWTYACKEDGVEIKKHKDTSTVCIQKTLDANGNRKEVSIRTDPDGEVRKSVYVYNPADKLITVKTFKGVDEVPQYEYDYTYLSDTILIVADTKSFDKGNLRWDRHMEYRDGQVTRDYSKSYKKGKLKGNWERRYVFDDQGLLVQHTSKNITKGGSYSQVYNYVKKK